MKENPSLIEEAASKVVAGRDYIVHLKSAFDGAKNVLAQNGQEVRGSGINRSRKYFRATGTVAPENNGNTELRMIIEASSPFSKAKEIKIWIQELGSIKIMRIGKETEDKYWARDARVPGIRDYPGNPFRAPAELAKTFSGAVGRFKPRNP